MKSDGDSFNIVYIFIISLRILDITSQCNVANAVILSVCGYIVDASRLYRCLSEGVSKLWCTFTNYSSYCCRHHN